MKPTIKPSPPALLSGGFRINHTFVSYKSCKSLAMTCTIQQIEKAHILIGNNVVFVDKGSQW